MENIYHDYWQQELMYQFLVEDKCKKKALQTIRSITTGGRCLRCYWEPEVESERFWD